MPTLDPVEYKGLAGVAPKKKGFIQVEDENGNPLGYWPANQRRDARRFLTAYESSRGLGSSSNYKEQLRKMELPDPNSKAGFPHPPGKKDRAGLIDEALLRVVSEGGGSKADSVLAGSRLQHLLPQDQVQAMLELIAKKAAAGRVPPEEKKAEMLLKKQEEEAAAAEKESEEIRKAQELQARDRVDVMTDWTPTKLGDRVIDLTRELAAAMKALEKGEEDLEEEDVLELDRERITTLQMHLNEALEAQGRQSKRQRPKE